MQTRESVARFLLLRILVVTHQGTSTSGRNLLSIVLRDYRIAKQHIYLLINFFFIN